MLLLEQFTQAIYDKIVDVSDYKLFALIKQLAIPA